MKAAQEYCRGCGLVTGHASAFRGGLRFGHIRAVASGGGPEIENTTIVCGACDAIMGTSDWSGIFDPLCDEPSWPAHAAEIANAVRHRTIPAHRSARPRG